MTIIFLIGLALLLWGLYPLGVILLYSPYRKAKIDELNVSIEPRQESRLYIMVEVYWVIVSYSYTVNGHIYYGKRVGFSDVLKFQNRQLFILSQPRDAIPQPA